MTEPSPIVLIVQPDEAVGEALAFALDLDGFQVRLHRKATSVLEDPDLSLAGCIITDDRMLPPEGAEWLEHLHRRIGVPVILLTDYATPALKTRAAAAGCRLIIEKPALDGLLADAIRSLLKPS